MSIQAIYSQLTKTGMVSVLVKDKAEMASLKTMLHNIKTRKNKEFQDAGLAELCDSRSLFTSVDAVNNGLQVTFSLRSRTLKEYSIIEVVSPSVGNTL